MYKEPFSAIAMALTFVAFFPYIRSIRRGATKPHVFSWVVWGLTTCIVFFAQLADHGGLGAWPTGVSGAITLYIALLAFVNRADVRITRSDWIFFFTALSAVPLWVLTADPLWAVILLTIVDVTGFGPTVRRAYGDPSVESMTFYALIPVRNVFVILALEHYSLTTMLFPAAVALACLVLITMMAVRKRVLTGSIIQKGLKFSAGDVS